MQKDDRQNLAMRRPAKGRLVKKLASYAGATTCAVFAHRQDALAAIVHTDFGPGGMALFNATFDLDLNADGAADFEIYHFSSQRYVHRYTYSEWRLHITPTQAGNHVVGRPTIVETTYETGTVTRVYPRAMDAGELIATTLPTATNGVLADTWASNYSRRQNGEFFNAGPKYLGLIFQIPGSGHHLGWAYVDDGFAIDSPVVFSFAYESEPGKAVLAGAVPEPPSLVLLAAGAAGLATLRIKRRLQS